MDGRTDGWMAGQWMDTWRYSSIGWIDDLCVVGGRKYNKNFKCVWEVIKVIKILGLFLS